MTKDVPSNAVGSTGCGLNLGPRKVGRLSMVELGFMNSMLKPEPKMMNICDCMGFLSISVWDQD